MNHNCFTCSDPRSSPAGEQWCCWYLHAIFLSQAVTSSIILQAVRSTAAWIETEIYSSLENIPVYYHIFIYFSIFCGLCQGNNMYSWLVYNTWPPSQYLLSTLHLAGQGWILTRLLCTKRKITPNISNIVKHWDFFNVGKQCPVNLLSWTPDPNQINFSNHPQ